MTERSRLLAHAALAWVTVFFALHVYWYLGGQFGHPGPLPGAPDSPHDWAFQVVVASAFPLGAWVSLAIARGWTHGRKQRAVAILVRLGCALLVLRGGAGLIDELTRTAGLLPNGITGLSLEDTMGTAHPSAHARWSSRATDAYFLLGGLVFGLLAYRLPLGPQPDQVRRPLDGVADGPARPRVGRRGAG